MKNQEDVLKILDLVSDELTKEYGSTIQIDKDNDITFRSTVIIDKDVDDVDTVLKRLTYMSDMEAEDVYKRQVVYYSIIITKTTPMKNSFMVYLNIPLFVNEEDKRRG